MLRLLSKITLRSFQFRVRTEEGFSTRHERDATRTERTGAVEAAAQGVRLIDHGVGSRER